MATHEFGIMPQAPAPGKRYDTYAPEKYHCIRVDDDWLYPLLEQLEAVDAFWHTLDRPEKGLAVCGITLIPPWSIPTALAILEGTDALAPLRALLRQAAAEGRFVIHYGL